jgi:hypothetical protein
MTLNYCNTKLDRHDSIVTPYSNIEKAIIENAIMLYGNDFYILTEINELEYSLNSYIKCNICI